MTVSEIIHVLENRILFLEQQKNISVINGELDKILNFEQEINEIQIALQKLKS